MANHYEPTPEQEADWQQWLAGRPEVIRKVASRFSPWMLYRMKSTGHRVVITSYSETDPVTLTVAVLGRFNRVTMERRVFGIDPDDLEECPLPGPDEELGSTFTQEQAVENLDMMRVLVRPDLWEMGEDGKARQR